MSLTRITPPSKNQTLALSKLLDSVFLDHGLSPEKDLPLRGKVAKDVHKVVCTKFPGNVDVDHYFLYICCYTICFFLLTLFTTFQSFARTSFSATFVASKQPTNFKGGKFLKKLWCCVSGRV